MKKNYYIVTLLALIFIISCNDDFMEKYPLDRVTDQSFWKSESDLELFCNPFYEEFMEGHGYGSNFQLQVPYGYNGSSFCYGDLHSDNGFAKDFNKAAMCNGTYIQPTGAGTGGWSWVTIRSLNYFLDNYNKLNIAQSKKQVYAGEILFFKAWKYFKMITLFGEVPWISKPLQTNSEELYEPKTPRNELMDSVLVTINKAIAWLPAKGSEKPDRLNRNMALLLKARICLYEGTFRKYHKELSLSGNVFLQEAADASNQLINSGTYSIWKPGNKNNDFHDLFVQATYKNNPEVILWKEYKSGVIGSATLRYYNYNSVDLAGCSKSNVMEYLCSDGLPISVSPLYLGDDSIQSEMTNRDPRLRQTICAPGEYAFNPANTSILARGQGYNKKMPNVPGTEPNWPTPGGYREIKYWRHDIDEVNLVGAGIMPCIIFRYAEALLINAEAQAELGQCNQAVLDATVNKLRDRVGMPHLLIGNIPNDPVLDNNYSTYCGYIPSP